MRSPAWLGRLLAVPETDGDRARTVVGTFVLHLRPVRVPAATIRFTHTFGLGGMSLVLLGMTHEKMGHQDVANEFYRKAYDMATGSNPPNVYSRAFTKMKLGLP